MANTPQKIAILGGGMGGLTAAYYLSSAPDWKSRFDITVHQLGHRLGGKCASSRGPFDRIEEHGIHGFLGSYYNALPLMAQVYEELGRKPGQPLATFEEALFGTNFSMLWEFRKGTFLPWQLRAEPNSRSPKDASTYTGLESTIRAIIDAIFGLAEQHAAAITAAAGPEKPHLDPIGFLKGLLKEARDAILKTPLSAGPNHPLVGIIKGARDLAGSPLGSLFKELLVPRFLR